MKSISPLISLDQMKKGFLLRAHKFYIFCFFLTIFSLSFCVLSYADININILAVNGTEKTKDKDILHPLPGELSREDILSTGGLQLEYDVNAGNYFVKGKVKLGPKESKTYKIRIRDIWQLDPKQIEDIKIQIDRSIESVKDVKGADYSETANLLKDRMLERIEFIVGEHGKYEDNIARRIETYRVYGDEIKDIRRKSFSLSYWKSDPNEEKDNVVKFNITVENTLEKERQTDEKHYMPKEVKPEHFISLNGFEIRHDEEEDTLYLQKQETLKSKEKKTYAFTLIDKWFIPPNDIEGLKIRTKDAFNGLLKTEYIETGKYLVKSIEARLSKIEVSQEQDLDIYEHISTFRKNQERFDAAKKDVEALEALLIAAKEEMEKSKLKNVLQKIKSLKTISVIAESIFKSPKVTVVLKVIIAIIVFVALFTLLWFIHWKRRTKPDMIQDEEETEAKE